MSRDLGALAPEWKSEFAVADRRCRVSDPKARDFLARAVAFKALGNDEEAQLDLRAALQADPADLEANRLALTWFDGSELLSAASRLIAGAFPNPQYIREALKALSANSNRITHRLQSHGEGVRGWVAWAGRQPVALKFANDREDWTAEAIPDPAHPLAGEGYGVAEIEAVGVTIVRDARDDSLLFRGAPKAAPDDLRKPPPPAAAGLTVIVPVYGGYEATVRCLDSLFSQQEIAFSVILVDDCSPDPRLSQLVVDAGLRAGVTALRNEVNLGFARSVNRALRLCGDDDALLLNADVWLPPRAIARLRNLVVGDPAIGTATPFSNNSQITSFPRPLLVNPTPEPAQAAELDRIAEEANGNIAVDVPSGIGFCLYISNRCLAAVGRVPEHYGRGYYEDVEFCLLAARKGFRNVCATGIFVAHEGSASFQSEKQGLTLRNSAILETRFPRQKGEFLAFAVADPLRAARAAIERRLPPSADGCTLMVASEGRALWQARRRAAELEAQGTTALLVAYTPSAASVAIRRAGAGYPASVEFKLERPGRDALVSYLTRADVKIVELFDVVRTPDVLFDALLALNVPIDIVGVDLWALRGAPAPRSGHCIEMDVLGPCKSCLEDYGSANEALPQREREARLVRAFTVARSVRSLDRMGAAFSQRIFGQRAAPFDSTAAGDVPPMASPGETRRLGILAPAASRECDRIAVRLARRLAGPGDNRRLVVFGSSHAEESLLATEAAWVTGPVEPEDYLRMARLYGVDRLATFDRLGLFGPLDAAARQLGVRKAYFDWSFGALEADADDLAIDPRVCDDKAAALVAFWLNSE